MKAPDYEWNCQKCGKANLAHTTTCAGCGFAAYFKVKDLSVAPVLPAPDQGASQNTFSGTWLMFFPEIIPAAILVLYAPFWALSLFAKGDALGALALLIGEVACVYGFVLGCRLPSKSIAYCSMVAFILLAVAISKGS